MRKTADVNAVQHKNIRKTAEINGAEHKHIRKTYFFSENYHICRYVI